MIIATESCFLVIISDFCVTSWVYSIWSGFMYVVRVRGWRTTLVISSILIEALRTLKYLFTLTPISAATLQKPKLLTCLDFRLFWSICCILSWVASVMLMLASWDDFQNNAISFVVETSYLDWNTKFPSISVCETDSQERLVEITDKIYGDPHDYNLDEMVKEMAFFRGLSFYTMQLCGTKKSDKPEQCPTNNFSIYSELVRNPCEHVFRKCYWNNVQFDCCRYFVPIDTELGTCYAVNSKQSRLGNSPRFEMISNKTTGTGSLIIELNGQLTVFTLGEEEVPSLTTLQTDMLQVEPHLHHRRYIAIKEIDNQPEVRDVNIRQRKCRFMEESYLDVYRHYSYSACCVQCRKNAHISKCNCTHHFMPNTPLNKLCDISGLECLNENYNELAVLKTTWSTRTGLVCNCLPSCSETELSIIRDIRSGFQANYAVVEISLDRLPSERFKRNVVRDRLDLIVSMGGGAALFLGASILSFVEIIYYFTVRPLSDSLHTKNEN